MARHCVLHRHGAYRINRADTDAHRSEMQDHDRQRLVGMQGE
jgi:hypothetical protein